MIFTSARRAPRRGCSQAFASLPAPICCYGRRSVLRRGCWPPQCSGWPPAWLSLQRLALEHEVRSRTCDCWTPWFGACASGPIGRTLFYAVQRRCGTGAGGSSSRRAAQDARSGSRFKAHRRPLIARCVVRCEPGCKQRRPRAAEWTQADNILVRPDPAHRRGLQGLPPWRTFLQPSSLQGRCMLDFQVSEQPARRA